MKKSLWITLLLVLILAGTLGLTAALAENSGTCGENLTWTINANGALIISGTGDMDDYTADSTKAPWYDLRASIRVLTVKSGVASIGNYAFLGCNNATSAFIQGSVTRIGDYAYSGCSSLDIISISGDVTYIGNGAFDGFTGKIYAKIDGNTAMALGKAGFSFKCSEYPDLTFRYRYSGNEPVGLSITGADTYMSSCTIPNGVTRIDSYAFRNCSRLTSIVIPNGVTSIGADAFYNCTSLISITIPSSVSSIGSSAFYGCSSLNNLYISNLESWLSISFDYNPFYIYSPQNWYLNGELLTSIVIPNSINSICNYAFSGCRCLTDVTIPDSVTSIGEDAFRYCYSLTNITIPDSVTSIGAGAFYGCKKLTNITLPDSMTGIFGSTFYGCTSLESIIIPDGVTSIGYGAFYNCSNLTSITIPASVTTFGESAFTGCSKLENLFLSSLETWLNISFSGVTSGRFPNEYARYWYLNGELLTNAVIPDGVNHIGSYGFSNCSTLRSVTIPNSVTRIDSGAFYNCSSLTSVTIPNRVTSINHSTFSGCSSLTSITIPDSVTSIGSYAFSGCSSLTSITIPDSVTSIDYSAFSGCSSLTNITILGKSMYFGNDVFGTTINEGLSFTVLPDSSSQAYAEANNIPYTFYRSELECPFTYSENTEGELTIISYTGSEASVEIPAVIDGHSVTRIGREAFKNCSFIETIAVPSSVTAIGVSAFDGCSSLTHIVIPENLTSIGAYAFNGCAALTSITIPNTVASIGEYTFKDCAALTTFTIPASLDCLNDGLFSGCTSLSRISIPVSITKVQSNVFNGCTSLARITFLGELPTLKTDSFAGCDTVGSISFSRGVIHPAQSTMYGVCGSSAIYEIVNGTMTVRGSGSTYWYDGTYNSTYYYDYPKPNTPWFGESISRVVIGEGITAVGSQMFSTLGSLSSVSLPNSLQRIGGEAFCRCSSLTSIILPPNVSEIAYCVFAQCRSLTSVTFMGSSPMIASNAFERVTANVYAAWTGTDNYEGNLTWINHNSACGENAFWTLSDTGVLRLSGSGVVSEAPWGDYSARITTLAIAQNLGGIGDHVLDGLSNLTGFIFEGKLPEHMGASAFAGLSAAAFYQHGDPSWAAEQRQSYGGSVTWQPYCASDGDTVTGCSGIHQAETAPSGCASDGWVAHWQCSVCGKAFIDEALTQPMTDEKRYIPAAPHTPVTDPGHPATCSEPGLTDGIACQVCGQTIQASEEIEKLPHTDTVTLEASEPTCIEAGHTEEHRCGVCGEILTASEEIPALGHNWGETVYSWAEDNTTVTAERICANDTSHVETENVRVTRIATVSPTNGQAGQSEWISNAFENEAFEIQRMQGDEIPALDTLSLLRLPSQLTAIEDEAFTGLSCEAVILPDACVSVGSSAFADCDHLVYIYIPSSTMTVAKDAFDGCPAVCVDWGK